MSCNAFGHRPDCACGWGGVYHGPGAPAPAGPRVPYVPGEFCRASTCPECRAPVYFVRHNGGSAWFDALGHPWPKHPCLDSRPDAGWLARGLPGGVEPGNREVFGVVTAARAVEPGLVARFEIECSDGTRVAGEFVYRLDPAANVGGLALLELTPTNAVRTQRFRVVEDTPSDFQGPTCTYRFGHKLASGSINLSFKVDAEQPPEFVRQIRSAGPGALLAYTDKVAVTVSVLKPALDKEKFSRTVDSRDLAGLFYGKWPSDGVWTLVVDALRDYGRK